ncbi:hypothetical protein [Nonomuraea gerenzanensis]|uniref:Uncharacterized protein n=1 Tax=Nonomuraea gerenzanensis TaxID=93944 RepID=A0A1M4BL74_9ACTN|nr:hypothetical protein [Nonomuraea gerenzanensis]UBU10027.1 hypothetical protein LCN96_37500 [Nonomuraea gerenzanensis]SAP16264.1 hypothetical protein BN4615_P10927 [Nonomuraea gerenzanensis]
MPKVRILTGISGVDVSYTRGQEVELDGPTATSWCEAGMAELVRDETPETPERTSAAKPETTARRSRGGRASKST